MSEKNATTEKPESVIGQPEGALERMYIEQYLRGKGHTLKSLSTLPEGEARQLMVEASAFASCRLAEVETRARFVRDIHYDESSSG